MNAVVIGGTGFIGSRICQSLEERGGEVFSLHRTANSRPGRELIADRADLVSVRRLIEKKRPDVVIDVIAYTAHDVSGMLETVKGLARKYVLISSQDVYRAFAVVQQREAGRYELPLDEGSETRREEYYYRHYADGPGDPLFTYSKTLAEETLRERAELEWTILRLPCVYGEHDRKHRFREWVVRMMEDRRFVILDSEYAAWQWTRGYVGDVAEAAALACVDDRSSGGVYNLGEPNAISEHEWVQHIGEAAGWNGDIIVADRSFLESIEVPEGDFSQNVVADTSNIRRELGFEEAVPRTRAVEMTVHWEIGGLPDSKDRTEEYRAEDRIANAFGFGNRE